MHNKPSNGRPWNAVTFTWKICKSPKILIRCWPVFCACTGLCIFSSALVISSKALFAARKHGCHDPCKTLQNWRKQRAKCVISAAAAAYSEHVISNVAHHPGNGQRTSNFALIYYRPSAAKDGCEALLAISCYLFFLCVCAHSTFLPPSR